MSKSQGRANPFVKIHADKIRSEVRDLEWHLVKALSTIDDHFGAATAGDFDNFTDR
jgi:hypothetical protein